MLEASVDQFRMLHTVYYKIQSQIVVKQAQKHRYISNYGSFSVRNISMQKVSLEIASFKMINAVIQVYNTHNGNRTVATQRQQCL